MQNVDTLEFLKLWGQINNINFKPTDFEGVKSKPGENAVTISPKKLIELTDAQKSYLYASEAVMLNVALFGMRVK
jgi:hypothetical protein